ncbi:ATP-binding protein [Streptomyces viridosporus]|uniref:ATP-binding protein n=1 Tax=Streptomyces viridosporus T7A TaxID=665577 RepID=A0ABX6AFD0_STRVD|nr:ATP-binding protein [Streptomyces viridosporus]QEU85468.1 hypothetical protein CP969_12610 [Streptomyces viridosporus T7A]
MTHEPTPDEYRTLLLQAPGSAFDADTEQPDLLRMFTPSSHRRALDPDVTVVLGARGTGKTYWTKALASEELRRVAADSYMIPRLRGLTVATGHGRGGGADAAYPGRRVIRKLVQRAPEGEGFREFCENFWCAVILTALRDPATLRHTDWQERIDWVADHPEAYDSALAAKDDEARRDGRPQLLIFDALEHLHQDRSVIDKMVSALFAAALDLRLGYSSLRAKIFVRPDMYDSAPKDFADASKLGANRAELTWTTENLYGMLFHRLGNQPGPEAEKFRARTGQWHSQGDGRYTAPVDVIADPDRQEQVFGAMAGPYMGANHRKGYTYTWLPNHLQDGNGQISPRTMLRAVSKAAEVTRDRHPGHEYALHHDAIRQAVLDASQIRVDEIKEDIRWAATAVEKLSDLQVPMEQSVVIHIWSTASLASELRKLLEDSENGSGPAKVDDYFSLIEELTKVGVMTRRASGAVDLPDVYRLAFNIGRKGGVSRPKRTAG